MTNGSSSVVWHNPENFGIEKTLTVRDNDRPVNNINEPELINGFLYANRWLTNDMLKIDTSTGMVTGKLDLSALVNRIHAGYPEAAELNGIAFDSAHDRILISGKL
jgi:glutamine cyclotransferase